MPIFEGPFKKKFSLTIPLKIHQRTEKTYKILYDTTGEVTLIPSMGVEDPFTVSYTKPSSLLLSPLFPKPIFCKLYFAAPKTYLSHIEIQPSSGFKYARSVGSLAKVISKNLYNHVILLELPSGVKKFFSIFSLSLHTLKKLQISKKTSKKAGHFSNYGKKPKVRGVAMNPVDHPHGGRTKSIKYPRTP